MKRIISPLLAILFCLNLFAGNNLTVFRAQGDIHRKRISETTWMPVRQRDTIKLSDKIRIPATGSIRILESGTGIIHTFSEEGVFTVKEIITRSREATKGLLGAVSGELAQELRNKASSGGSYKSHGATSRGDKEEDDKVLEALYRSIISGDKDLTVSLVPEGDTFRFRINNRDGAALVSVLCIRPGEAAFSLPPEGILVGTGNTLLQTPEVFPSADARYAVFRVNEPYESGALLLYFRQ